MVLLAVVGFVLTLSDLINMDRSKFTNKDQMELLFTLVPTIALLFGSFYNLDFFFKNRKKKKSRKKKMSASEEGIVNIV